MGLVERGGLIENLEFKGGGLFEGGLFRGGAFSRGVGQFEDLR